MSKLSYVFVTLIGAVPAGWALFHLITTLMNKANELSVVILSVVITLAVCMVLIVLSPFIVAIFYKDTRPRPQKKDATAVDEETEAGTASATVASSEGFGDAIPDDFDEDEARAASDDDEEYDDDEYDDDEYEDDFDMDEFDDDK